MWIFGTIKAKIRKSVCVIMEKNLCDERKKEIAAIANDIRRKYNLVSPNFDLIKFLKEYEGFEILLTEFDDETTGVIMVDDKRKLLTDGPNKIILINKDYEKDLEYFKKRRFICAHEYGHYILHKKGSVEFAMRDTRIKDTLEEKEAEYFAYCLLMPETAVRSICDNSKKEINELLSFNETTLSSIFSDIFNVSIKKASVRLSELGIGDINESKS